MKGFAMLGMGKTGWIEKARPVCGALDAIVRPIAVSPCTSDVHTVWEGALGERKDMILGHEAVGEVVEVGSLVRDFAPGDRVIVTAITPDWGSEEAQRGFAMHSGGMLAGWKFSNYKDGVFAEFFHVNEADANLAKLPDELDPGTACMLCDMMPTGFHAAELAEIGFGESVCVIGIGPVGLMAVRACVLRGAGDIFCVGTRKVCMDAAKQYGATDFLSYKNGDLAEQILDRTKGKGVDKVVVAGGNADTFDAAIRMLKPGGIVANVNYLGSGDYVKLPRVEWGCGMAHKQIRGGLMPGGRLRAERLLRLIETGRVDPSLLLTHIFYGFSHVEQALYLMKDKTQEWTWIWPQLSNDGHPSYCPTDNHLVVFDTYPSRSRIQEVKLGLDTDKTGESVKTIAKVFSPFKYDNNTRCDLHPRWRQDGKAVCFDSIFEGRRGLYVVEL